MIKVLHVNLTSNLFRNSQKSQKNFGTKINYRARAKTLDVKNFKNKNKLF